MNAPETILYTAVVSLLHRFNWKRIAIVKQDEDLFNEVGENSPYLALNKQCHYSGGRGQGTGTANKGRNNSKNAGKKRGKPNSTFLEKLFVLSFCLRSFTDMERLIFRDNKLFEFGKFVKHFLQYILLNKGLSFLGTFEYS